MGFAKPIEQYLFGNLLTKMHVFMYLKDIIRGATLMNGKKLYRNTENKMLAGVCSGIADYFDIDPTLVRLGWVLFSLLGGSGLLAYIIAAIIIPDAPKTNQ